MSDDDEFTFNPDEDDDEEELSFDSDDDDDEYDDDELDEEARLAEAKEIARLRWEIDALKEVHQTLRDHYHKEMRSLIEPLVDKHRELKDDNRRLHAELAAAIQARDDADFEIKNAIADLRTAHQALVARSDDLEVDSRLGRRLQAEMDDADAKIAGLEGDIAELERDCRKLERELAEVDREHEALRQQTAQTTASAAEWRQRYEQALADNAAEIAMYQEQIGEATEQAIILDLRAQEFHQLDHLLPELHDSLRAERATFDSIEALLFPRTPEPDPEPVPVLAAVGGGGDGPSPPRSASGSAPWSGTPEGPTTDEATAGDDGLALAASSPEAMADAAAWPAEAEPEVLPDGAADDAWPAGDPATELTDDTGAWPPGDPATALTDDTDAWPAAVPDAADADDPAAWPAEPDLEPPAAPGTWEAEAPEEAMGYGWDTPRPTGRETTEDPSVTAQRRRDEMLAYGMPVDTGEPMADADWPTSPVDDAGWGDGTAEPSDGPIGAVGIPGFEDESASP